MKHLGPNLGFAIIVLGVFLLGAWFIRSGVMADPAAHLELFRWMAWIGIPLGLGLSLVAARIALTHVPGQNDGAFQLSMGLAFIGNLPACLGYIGVVVLLLHGRWRDWLAPLAPVGRMALSTTSCSPRSARCSSTVTASATGACRARSNCSMSWWCSRCRCCSAAGGWRSSASGCWNGCGAG